MSENVKTQVSRAVGIRLRRGLVEAHVKRLGAVADAAKKLLALWDSGAGYSRLADAKERLRDTLTTDRPPPCPVSDESRRASAHAGDDEPRFPASPGAALE